MQDALNHEDLDDQPFLTNVAGLKIVLRSLISLAVPANGEEVSKAVSSIAGDTRKEDGAVGTN